MSDIDGAAARAYRAGNAFALAGDRAAAAERFRAALAHDPLHGGALNNLANLLRADGDVSAAIACYRRVLAIRPDLGGTMQNLAAALLQLHRPRAALEILGKAMALRPDDAESWNLSGGAHLALDEPETARTCFGRATALDPNLVNAHMGEAMALLAMGRLPEGFAAYERRWSDPVFIADEPRFAAPTWRGEPLAGRVLLIHAEQGLGDTIQFSRYVPMAAESGASVIFVTPPALAGLFGRLADQVVASDDNVPQCDVHCPLLSLPHLFRTDLATIPPPTPIAPDPERVAAWGPRLGPKIRPRVGIAFSGSESHPEDALRSIFSGVLVEALANVAVDLHVLQTDFRAVDAACLAAIPFVTTHADRLTDFSETAALVTHMDLVVSVDTSVAHLAATLGRPTWILVQFAADWRWLRQRTDSPWYPAARLFRQTVPDDWSPVLEKIAAELPVFLSRQSV